ncbi:BLUF domain-containing protein [Paraglaciecola arctica]|uniref:BLUF domain-containing protein n=1 Tax=Paraglaciecola arctica TaxID=1128911 RepID=UPI001C07E91D|nr:BLUF domain-containing protein [Paraglaciecola arctica]MBU3003681.1 BLUF domain-containing protein [Paraglaciecola arctica]
MYQLIYVSDKIETFTPSDMEEILCKARKNNAQYGITGLLVELPEHFIQILEGTQDKVEFTFNLICEDIRHTNIRVLLAEKTRAREMESWDMGFSEDLDPSQLDDARLILNNFSEKQNFSDIHRQSLKLLLKSLCHE